MSRFGFFVITTIEFFYMQMNFLCGGRKWNECEPLLGLSGWNKFVM